MSVLRCRSSTKRSAGYQFKKRIRISSETFGRMKRKSMISFDSFTTYLSENQKYTNEEESILGQRTVSFKWGKSRLIKCGNFHLEKVHMMVPSENNKVIVGHPFVTDSHDTSCVTKPVICWLDQQGEVWILGYETGTGLETGKPAQAPCFPEGEHYNWYLQHQIGDDNSREDRYYIRPYSKEEAKKIFTDRLQLPSSQTVHQWGKLELRPVHTKNGLRYIPWRKTRGWNSFLIGESFQFTQAYAKSINGEMWLLETPDGEAIGGVWKDRELWLLKSPNGKGIGFKPTAGSKVDYLWRRYNKYGEVVAEEAYKTR